MRPCSRRVTGTLPRVGSAGLRRFPCGSSLIADLHCCTLSGFLWRISDLIVLRAENVYFSMVSVFLHLLRLGHSPACGLSQRRPVQRETVSRRLLADDAGMQVGLCELVPAATQAFLASFSCWLSRQLCMTRLFVSDDYCCIICSFRNASSALGTLGRCF